MRTASFSTVVGYHGAELYDTIYLMDMSEWEPSRRDVWFDTDASLLSDAELGNGISRLREALSLYPGDQPCARRLGDLIVELNRRQELLPTPRAERSEPETEQLSLFD